MASRIAEALCTGPLKTWLSQSSGCVTLVIAGRSGSGKSTLLKNLLPGHSCQPLHSQESDTKHVQVFKYDFVGVQLTIIDVPGLHSSDQNDVTEITKELQSRTNGEADVLLYCASVSPSSRLGEEDGRIINLLKTVFGPSIWERAVLIFTFADYVMERNKKNPSKNPTVEHVMEDYARRFEEILKMANIESFTVLPLLQEESEGERAYLRPPQQIPALPASETPSTKLLSYVNWDDCVYLEMLKKCKLDAVPKFVSVVRCRNNSVFFGTLIVGAGVLAVIAKAIGMSVVTVIILGVIAGSVCYCVVTAVSRGPKISSIARSIAEARFHEKKEK